MEKCTTEPAKANRTNVWKPQEIIQLQKTQERYRTFIAILDI